jgi:ABC-type phosphate/phosphonate transport system substrate-binding protein
VHFLEVPGGPAPARASSHSVRTMTASLPWYDLVELRDSTDALWAALSRRLRREGFERVPARLDRGTPFERQWEAGDLLFGQACGYDVVLPHRDRLRIVATPRYSAAGCGSGTYRSRVVVRDGAGAGTLEELRGRACAINSPTSHSGWNGLRALVAPLHRGGRFFGRVVRSGSHEASLEMLHAGRADVASIDCVTWALLERRRPAALEGLRTIAWTEEAAAPPFVTARASSDGAVRSLRAALEEAFADPALAAARGALLLSGIEFRALDAYAPIAAAAARARELGYDSADWEGASNA